MKLHRGLSLGHMLMFFKFSLSLVCLISIDSSVSVYSLFCWFILFKQYLVLFTAHVELCHSVKY